MNTKKRAWLIVIAALLGFSCAPGLAPVAPTLDPLSMNTALALTAGAASAQTAAVAQGPQPALVLMEGPTLDPAAFNTAVALTSVAAAARTQALIPNTLTPSVTSLPTKTPTITPTVTNTFVLTPVPVFTLPVPTSTKKSGGGGGNDGGGYEPPYSCKTMRVSPSNESVLGPDTQFEVVWLVKNKGQNWPKKTVHIVYDAGTLISLVNDRDLPPLSMFDISGGDIVSTPSVAMKTPSNPGTYWTHWWIYVGNLPACGLELTIIVRDRE